MKFIKKLNNKKCDKALTKVHNLLRDQDKCIITLSTTKGYDAFFDKLKNEGLLVTIDDSMRESIFVTIEKKDKEIKYVN